jgi:serine/threonine protein kinase
MLDECLAGFPPFDGMDGYSVGYKHVHEKPVPITDVESRVPMSLARVVMQCLEKDPAARPQRGHELADALYAFLSEAGDHTPLYVRTVTPGGSPAGA